MNNRANYIIIIVGILIVCGCSKALPQTIDFPYYGFRNSDSQEIVRVERTDTATVFHMKSFYFPDMWIRVAKETYLTDGKRRYALLSAEGIVPGEKLVMGSDGQAEYKLVFEPLPAKTRYVHFIEGKIAEGAFIFYYIDLSGNKPLMPKLNRVPETLIEPSLKHGRTTVEVHFPFKLDGLEAIPMTLKVRTFLPGDQQEYDLVTDNDGNASVSIELYGPAKASLYCRNVSLAADIVLDPGETVHITADGSLRINTVSRFSLNERCSSLGYCEGRLTAPSNIPNYWWYRFSYPYPYKFRRVDSGIQPIAAIKEAYSAKQAELAANDSIPAILREYLDKYIKAEAVKAINRAYDAYEFSDEDLGFLKELNLDDKDMLYVYDGQLRSDLALRIDPLARGWQAQYAKFLPLMKKLLNSNLMTEEDIAMLDSLSEPIFKETALALQRRAQKVQLQNDEVHFRQLPANSTDPLGDILKQYRGNVILVDFWATWCGPCKEAHKIMEPMKEGSLKDVTFVYVTNPSSLVTEWKEMVSNIKGEHYYLTEEQFNTIYKKIDSKEYPTYLIVAKDGTILNKIKGYRTDIPSMLENAL